MIYHGHYFFVIYHNYVSDWLRNFLTLPFGSNSFSNSVEMTVLLKRALALSLREKIFYFQLLTWFHLGIHGVQINKCHKNLNLSCLNNELLVHLSVSGLNDLLLHGHGTGRLVHKQNNSKQPYCKWNTFYLWEKILPGNNNIKMHQVIQNKSGDAAAAGISLHSSLGKGGRVICRI